MLSRLILFLVLHTISLSWKQSKSPNLVYNDIYCGLKSGGPYTYLKYQTDRPAVSFSTTTTKAGTVYCIVTATEKIDGVLLQGGPSNEVKIVIP
jgi:hypothetical protein